MPSDPAPAWGAWPPELDVEIEFGDHESTGCGSRHGTRRAVSAPEPGVTHAVYGCILHHLPSLVVALLKLLLAAGGLLPHAFYMACIRVAPSLAPLLNPRSGQV